MLIRDLQFVSHEPDYYFDTCWYRLSDGSGLFVQRATKQTAYCDAGSWSIFHADKCFSHARYLSQHNELDEFEAQAVFDYYLGGNRYGAF